jgi:hypothetical protein
MASVGIHRCAAHAPARRWVTLACQALALVISGVRARCRNARLRAKALGLLMPRRRRHDWPPSWRLHWNHRCRTSRRADSEPGMMTEPDARVTVTSVSVTVILQPLPAQWFAFTRRPVRRRPPQAALGAGRYRSSLPTRSLYRQLCRLAEYDRLPRSHLSLSWFYRDGERFYVSRPCGAGSSTVFSRDPRVQEVTVGAGSPGPQGSRR